MEEIKLIWDFRGPNAQKTAEHHLIHLKEYIKINELSVNISGVETLSNLHSLAYIVVSKAEMIPLRDALKPHRGQVFNS